MVQISEVVVISIDKNDDAWEIEGEALFESDLPAVFSVRYLLEDDELEGLELEIDCKFDRRLFKEMLLQSVHEFED